MKKYFLLFLLIVLSVFFFSKRLKEFPSHIHAWAQADRYAIALGFLNNGMDFFHPQSYNLNLQFKAKERLKFDEGITAVDFPIHEYIIAIIMKATGRTSPFIFRFYTLLYSLAGLFFLFKLAQLFTDSNSYKEFLLPLFAFTSPVFTYYMDGFLPTATSLSNLFIGWYFFFSYKKSGSINHFYISIIFITLAALTRLPFAVFLIAIISLQIVSYFKNSSINLKEVKAFAISISAIAGYFIYNSYLRRKYGSMFLSSFIYPKSLHEFNAVLKIVYTNWFFQYFTWSHYLVFILIAIAAVITFIKEKTRLNALQKQLLFQVAITTAGAAAYFLIMAVQFKEHDYYFLDSLFPVAVLMLTLLLSMINLRWKNYITLVLILGISFMLAWQCSVVQAKRNETGRWDHYQVTIDNFTGADKFLDENHVAPNARILVINSYTPNIPFILMKRKGYCVIPNIKTRIAFALTWKYDYVVMQNEFILDEVLPNYPELKDYLAPLATNGKITLYNYLPVPHLKSLLEFLGFDKLKPAIDESINFDDTITKAVWTNTDKVADKMMCDSDHGNTNNFSAYADSSIEYGATFHLPAARLDTAKNHTILFEGDFCSPGDLKDVLISCYAGHDDVVNYQQYFDLNAEVKEKSTWKHVELLFAIEKINAVDELKVFIWNPKRKFVCYDNWRVRVF